MHGYRIEPVSILDYIVQRISQGFASTGRQISDLRKAVRVSDAKLDQILAILAGPVDTDPAATVLNLSIEENMKPITRKTTASAGTSLDLQMLDTGKALASISFVDSLQEPTNVAAGATVASTFSSSDAGVIVTDRGDGLNADISLVAPAPVPLPTGVVITAVTTVTNLDGSVLGPFTATGNPIDVIAGGPAGIMMVETAE